MVLFSGSNLFWESLAGILLAGIKWQWVHDIKIGKEKVMKKVILWGSISNFLKKGFSPWCHFRVLAWAHNLGAEKHGPKSSHCVMKSEVLHITVVSNENFH